MSTRLAPTEVFRTNLRLVAFGTLSLGAPCIIIGLPFIRIFGIPFIAGILILRITYESLAYPDPILKSGSVGRDSS